MIWRKSGWIQLEWLGKEMLSFWGEKLAKFEPFLIKFVKAKLIQNNSKSA